MSEKIKPGDRVRVVFEGDVTGVYGDGELDVRFGPDTWHDVIVPGEYVEKIEPPVEVFKPGDRLRRKWETNAYEVTLGSEGYLHHSASCGGTAYRRYNSSDRDFFTSENFEKVYPG